MNDPMSMNYLAVLLAAVASMVVGFVWYGPMLFGSRWMKLMGLTKADMDAAKSKMGVMYGKSFVAAIVTAFVLSYFLIITGETDMMGAVMIAFWAWLGFVVTIQYTDVLFGNKKMELFVLNAFYQLASLIAMALVLSMWK